MKTKCESQQASVVAHQEIISSNRRKKTWTRFWLKVRTIKLQRRKTPSQHRLLEKDQDLVGTMGPFHSGWGSSEKRPLKFLNPRGLCNFGAYKSGPHIPIKSWHCSLD